MKSILFRIRWWRWLLTGPTVAEGIIRGWDKQTRDIIFQRWMEKEPRQ